jgi:hypothetical protein
VNKNWATPSSHSGTSNIPSLHSCTKSPSSAFDHAPTVPEISFSGNHFLPVAPATGLGEVQHRRRGAYDEVEDRLSYSLRRYLTTLSPQEQEHIGLLAEGPNHNANSFLRQDTYLLGPSPTGRGSCGRNSRSHSLQSGSRKSVASGWMSYGLDPVIGSGGWFNGDSTSAWPMIADEDGIDDEDHAAHIAASRDREEHEEQVARRNLTCDLETSVHGIKTSKALP